MPAPARAASQRGDARFGSTGREPSLTLETAIAAWPGFAAVGGVLAQRNARIFYSGQRGVLDRFLGATDRHRLAGLGTDAFDAVGGHHRRQQLWVPSVVISPIAGAVADRMDRVKLTMASQYVAMAQSIILVALILTGTIRIEFMALLSFCNGAAEVFAQPARQCSASPGLPFRDSIFPARWL